jgi:methyl-accepting chemotaxis protein/methyl-accepting chemotaxis protein-1 (serine sensor receptor)
MPGIIYSDRVLAEVLQLRVGYWRHIALQDRDAKTQIEGNAEILKQKINEDLAGYQRQISLAEDRAEFSKIRPALDHYLQTWAELQPLSREGRISEVVTLAPKAFTPAFNELQKLLMERTAWNKEHGERAAAAARADGARARLLTWVFSLISLVTGTWLAFVIVRKTSRELRHIAAELSGGAGNVLNVAGQVSASCQSLARGSSEQAASLEETSAATEQVHSMVRNNASNARGAAELTRSTQKTIQQANESLGQMVIAMDEVRDSSGKISKIIKLIDEIAFQTNILALNAAVESATAGEAGLGFAVVADEVRNLAQRCTKAAQETAVLIEESVQRSTSGKSRVDELALAIASITEASERITGLVDEVKAGSEEQSKGLEQITQAISQIDQVTQTAAASAQEGAAAAGQLNAQSNVLRNLVAGLTEMAGHG